MPALVIVLGIVIVAAAAWFSFQAKIKRRRELFAVAARLGLEFSVPDPFGLVDLPFALFSKGDGRGCENVLSGSWRGAQVKAFDYWYYEKSTDSRGGSSRTYHRFSCALFPISAGCPHLTLQRENLLTRLADAVGFHDIEFESEEFNRAFQVKSSDRKFAYALIDARMMQWLIAGGGDCAYELAGPSVLCATRRLRPAAIEWLLGRAHDFADHVPSVVASLYPLR